MSSRVTSAISSRRAKQELVKLLFGPKYAGKGPEAHRKLDHTIYSYSELRTAYLERLQAIHPDKLKHHHTTDGKNQATHSQFVELQDVWDKYEEVAKRMQKVGKPEEASFTMFGVGCSFADSPEERAMRDAITDQACRGWFSAGSLAEQATEGDPTSNTEFKAVPLCDDDLFVEHNDGAPTSNGHESQSQPTRSLIQGFKPKR